MRFAGRTYVVLIVCSHGVAVPDISFQVGKLSRRNRDISKTNAFRTQKLCTMDEPEAFTPAKILSKPVATFVLYITHTNGPSDIP